MLYLYQKNKTNNNQIENKIMTTEKDLYTAMHIMNVQSESRVLLEKAINDLNTLKHQCFSEELKRDINTSIDLLEKHKDSFKFQNVRKSILQEISLNN